MSQDTRSLRRRNIIGGADASGDAWTPNVNPSDTSDVIGEYARGSASDAQEAVAAARASLPRWAFATPQERADVLDRAGDEIVRRADELGDLLAREEGKTLPEARGEVVRAGQILKFHGGQALRNTGEVVDSIRPGVEVAVTREPLGVVSVITPWNFPIAIPAWKIAPALAYGNTVIFKPAELVPGCAWELVDVLRRAGLPDGVLNLVMGSGRDVGPVLTGSPEVDGISFTGSVATGEQILAESAPQRTRLQLEMGGKNPLVVLDDADLGVAVEVALQGAFGSTGQRCTASSRLVVTRGIHDRFVAALTEQMLQWRVDDARTDGTHMGPVVDAAQLAQDERYLAIARDEGGQLIGGDRVERSASGHYLSPALVVGTDNSMTVNREEVFGPVASVVEVADYEEALAVANATEFGLCSGIVTTSLAAASHFRRHSLAGMVMVNVPTAGVDYHVPFGGRRASSYGPREQGTYAKEFYTLVKTSYTAPGAP
ncbi:MAG: aldehyde dehydrogenase family protein [Actinomycetia bacterium]|nr:aldehyde dehydrogenase family protein [Actinomycetes bacterium]